MKMVHQPVFLSLNSLLDVQPPSRRKLIEQIDLHGAGRVRESAEKVKGKYKVEHHEVWSRVIARLLIAALDNLRQYYSKEQLCELEKGTKLPIFRLEKQPDIAPRLSAEYHYSFCIPGTAKESKARHDLILRSTKPWLKVLCACNQWVIDGGTDYMVLNFAARAKIEADKWQSTLDAAYSLKGSISVTKKLAVDFKEKRYKEINQRLQNGENRKTIASEMRISESTISRSINKK